MKERPILFSAPMVRAIREGRKTQTRRIVKPHPLSGFIDPEIFEREFEHHGGFLLDRVCAEWRGTEEQRGTLFRATCPYGRTGDRLWVRETFVCDDYRYPDGPVGSLKRALFYRADDENPFEAPEGKFWRPSIHMPRWASRILLEVTGVRVERLQDISEEDAKAEGCDKGHRLNEQTMKMDLLDYRGGYRKLWADINGWGSWDANPWVWVISFDPHLSHNKAPGRI